jgi:hypothetical protein
MGCSTGSRERDDSLIAVSSNNCNAAYRNEPETSVVSISNLCRVPLKRLSNVAFEVLIDDRSISNSFLKVDRIWFPKTHAHVSNCFFLCMILWRNCEESAIGRLSQNDLQPLALGRLVVSFFCSRYFPDRFHYIPKDGTGFRFQQIRRMIKHSTLRGKRRRAS